MNALLRALCLIAAGVCAEAADEEPCFFRTTAEAEDYAKSLFAGGEVQVFDLGDEKVLVLRVFGSGVPDIGFWVFAAEEGAWRLASRSMPPIPEMHRLEVDSGALFIVGEETGTRTKIHPTENEATQSSQPTTASRRGERGADARRG
ncbi:hypothetical protein [Actomonas aquatica]|uniref:Uncharacterized protein n=1 Tax=Actomonas aquatica TaxID=2866162 RepID=A0ABZ1CCT1_9BACT|nr:hypothetical protein [Opitutus sp. WL0086]WRQ89236.1 hypothetical protein K1X11_007435 [Opitutus sp. WL0086]